MVQTWNEKVKKNSSKPGVQNIKIDSKKRYREEKIKFCGKWKICSIVPDLQHQRQNTID